MKTLSIITMLAALTAFFWLAFYSLAYHESKPKKMTLGELVIKATAEAEAHHRARKPRKMTKADQQQALAYLFTNKD